MTDIGHNSTLDASAQGQLKAFIARIEHLEVDKATVAQDLKDVYSEAKAMGFDAKILRKVISLRKIDEAKRIEQEALLDLYMGAIQGELGI